MRARAMLRTAILAATLAAGVSCWTPLVEGPAPGTSQRSMLPSHPCTTKAIRGGKNSSCHILFQTHKNMLTNKISENGVRSQIFLYHSLSDLIKNHGVRVVLLEGANMSEDVRRSIITSYGRKGLDDAWSVFGKCMGSTIRTYYGVTKGIRVDLSGLPDNHEEVNFCLAKTMWHHHRLAGFSKLFLIFQNPHVFFTGVERDRKALQRKMKKYKRLMRLKECLTALFGPLGGNGHHWYLVSLIKERITKERNVHMERDAIEQALRYSSRNTALVVGVSHKDSIEGTIRTIPFHKRPTFYFVAPECQSDPGFSVSSQTLDLAAKASAGPRTKQSL